MIAGSLVTEVSSVRVFGVGIRLGSVTRLKAVTVAVLSNFVAVVCVLRLHTISVLRLTSVTVVVGSSKVGRMLVVVSDSVNVLIKVVSLSSLQLALSSLALPHILYGSNVHMPRPTRIVATCSDHYSPKYQTAPIHCLHRRIDHRWEE